MAKGVYIGVGGKAHKVKKPYIGVGGKAHKVKKAYIGVGGKARLCYVNGPSSVANLSVARYGLAGATNGTYAIFAGGSISNGSTSTVVDAYNGELVRSAAPACTSRTYLSGIRFGNYAIIVGSAGVNTLEAYNQSLTRTTPASGADGLYAATAVAGSSYLMVKGSGETGYIRTYNASFTASTKSTYYILSEGNYTGSTSVGNYGIFAVIGNPHHLAYNTSLTETVLNNGGNDFYGRGATVGSYGLMTSGQNNTKVHAYNASLSYSNPTALASASAPLGASSAHHALFGGVHYRGLSATNYSNVVEAYNTSLSKTTPAVLGSSKQMLASAEVNGYILFAGGKTTGGAVATVDAYDADLNKIPAA